MAWVNLSGAFGYGTILTSTQMQNLRDNITALANGDPGAPKINYLKVGTYQGDGTTDQGITGIGFTPDAVLVCSQSDTTVFSGFLRIEGMDAGLALIPSTGRLYANTLISLDADGFSVDDEETDAHPNKNGHDYIYFAWRATV